MTGRGRRALAWAIGAACVALILVTLVGGLMMASDAATYREAQEQTRQKALELAEEILATIELGMLDEAEAAIREAKRLERAAGIRTRELRQAEDALRERRQEERVELLRRLETDRAEIEARIRRRQSSN